MVVYILEGLGYRYALSVETDMAFVTPSYGLRVSSQVYVFGYFDIYDSIILFCYMTI